MRFVYTALLAAAFAGGPEPARGATPLAQAQEAAGRRGVTGTWQTYLAGERLALTLSESGEFAFGESTAGTYDLRGNALYLHTAVEDVSYETQLAGEQLTLSGGDLLEPLVFTRRPQLSGYASWFFGLRPREIADKTYRILTVAGVVCAAWLVIWLLQAATRLVIFSEWSLLRFVYQRHKNRALTIHSLVLNLVKYVIFFTALGFVLGELGVNYTAYLASLSVIGLAIGFGSQGLVQDMVTGFFVIFEGQYDVGDMVEISGQTGVVQELGLRMTRLRNYLGQTVVIPNRNIAVVGNFVLGGQQVRVDVAVGQDRADKARSVLRQASAEVARQFSGIVLAAPRVGGPLELATGERFLRVRLTIWPQQQWVIEQQLVSRIRESFAREGLEIPNDRVVVFYHGRRRRRVRYRRRPASA